MLIKSGRDMPGMQIANGVNAGSDRASRENQLAGMRQTAAFIILDARTSGQIHHKWLWPCA